jgi:hypothetical protein
LLLCTAKAVDFEEDEDEDGCCTGQSQRKKMMMMIKNSTMKREKEGSIKDVLHSHTSQEHNILAEAMEQQEVVEVVVEQKL